MARARYDDAVVVRDGPNGPTSLLVHASCWGRARTNGGWLGWEVTAWTAYYTTVSATDWPTCAVCGAHLVAVNEPVEE